MRKAIIIVCMGGIFLLIVALLNYFHCPSKRNIYIPPKKIDKFPIILKFSKLKVLPMEAPNILFVVYDARRFDDFSLDTFGNLRHDTPFLNEFKKDAIFFIDAISPGVWTFPVHSAYFTGLRIFDLKTDINQKNYSKLPKQIPTLARIFKRFGYLTVAYPDHPYFYSGYVNNSLIKDFDYFNVIMNFKDYASKTNVGTKGRKVIESHTIPKNSFKFSDEVIRRLKKFNAKKIVFNVENSANLDPESGVFFPKLWPLFSKSKYFYNRYQREFDDYIFTKEHYDKPKFIFFNLHMCTIAIPDEKLFYDWCLLLLMINAQKKNMPIILPEEKESFKSFYIKNIKRLDLRYKRKGKISNRYIFVRRYDKHIFDNRFYDCNFQAIINYLKGRNLFDNTITIVTSDHGLSFAEHGEKYHTHGGARPFDYSNVKVPLIIKFPENSKFYKYHGRYKDRVSTLDIFYTILHCSIGDGLYETTEVARGKSLLKRISEDDYEQFIISESSTQPKKYFYKPWSRGEMIAIYNGNYKFIHGDRMSHVLGKKSMTQIRDTSRKFLHLLYSNNIFLRREFKISYLFNLKEDPYEQNNLIGRRKNLENLFSRRYIFYLNDRYDISGLTRPARDVKYSKKTLKTLRTLGYIE